MNTLRKELDRHRSHVFCAFPEDARWNAARQAVGFGVEIGEYSGVVWVPRRVPWKRRGHAPIFSITGLLIDRRDPR
jgi:hypothetical protein